MDHYEVQGWRCVHHHFYVTQLSRLFCAINRQQFDRPTANGFHVATMAQARRAVNVCLATSGLFLAKPHDGRGLRDAERT